MLEKSRLLARMEQTLNVTLEILVQEAIEEVESNEQSG
jgi:hypothetical protein